MVAIKKKSNSLAREIIIVLILPQIWKGPSLIECKLFSKLTCCYSIQDYSMIAGKQFFCWTFDIQGILSLDDEGEHISGQ